MVTQLKSLFRADETNTSSCTEKGDLVGDFSVFCLSFLKAANDMDRCWVGCDVETWRFELLKRLDA